MRQAIQIAAAAALGWGAYAHSAHAAPAAHVAPPVEAYSEEGTQACLDCHETPSVMGILKTVHFKSGDPKTPATTRQCQSCHGPSAKHMMFPMQVENVHFGKSSTSPAEQQNARCLECHKDDKSGHRRNWTAGAHGYEKVVCSTCHSLHDPDKLIPARADVKATCASAGCHDQLVKESQGARYTHSLGKNMGGKGELTCSGCHNPHGPLESSRCLDCHPQTPEVFARQSEKAKRFHAVAEAKGTDCIRCHKGIAHPIPPLALEKSRSEMDRMIRK